MPTRSDQCRRSVWWRRAKTSTKCNKINKNRIFTLHLWMNFKYGHRPIETRRVCVCIVCGLLAHARCHTHAAALPAAYVVIANVRLWNVQMYSVPMGRKEMRSVERNIHTYTCVGGLRIKRSRTHAAYAILLCKLHRFGVYFRISFKEKC